MLALVAVACLAGSGCGEKQGADALRDGRYFGYVRAVAPSPSPPTISVDVAEFLVGEEANKAALAAGAIEKGESVPNDYFVRNVDKSLLVLPVASDVSVTHVQCAPTCREKIPGRFAAFAASFHDPEPKSLLVPYRGAQSQYWIIVARGEVVAIDEMYLP